MDHRADIYSLGVVFYELLTGELPLGRFDAPSQKVEVDVRVDEVVLRTLEKDPPRRYQHASEVKTRVDDISSGRLRRGHHRHDAPRDKEKRHMFVAAFVWLVSAIIGTVFAIQNFDDGSVALLLAGPWALIGLVAAIFFLVALVRRLRRHATGPGWAWLMGVGVVALAAVPVVFALFVMSLLLVGARRAEMAHAEAVMARQLAEERQRELEIARDARQATLPVEIRDSDLHTDVCERVDLAVQLVHVPEGMFMLRDLARQPGLSEHEQVHLLEAIFRSPSASQAAAAIVQLIENQDLAPAARAVLENNLDRLGGARSAVTGILADE